MKTIGRTVLMGMCFVATWWVAAQTPGEEITQIHISDRVLLENPTRIGLSENSMGGGGGYYGHPYIGKHTVMANFEGGIYRGAKIVSKDSTGQEIRVNGGGEKDEKFFHIGQPYWILSGASRWMQGKLQAFRTEGAEVVLTLDQAVKVKAKDGIMLEHHRPEEGDLEKRCLQFPDSEIGQREKNLVSGDVPPNGGHVSYCIAGLKGPQACLKLATIWQNIDANDVNSTWHLQLWARAKAGKPVLKVAPSPEWGTAQVVNLTSDWKEYNLTLVIDKAPQDRSNQHLLITLQPDGGDVLVDNLLLTQGEDKNPTVLKDEVIATLKKLRIGIIRPTMRGAKNAPFLDLLRPFPLGSRTSIYDDLLIAEAIGDCAYYINTPACFTQEEMTQLMEYLAGPTNSPMGKLRAACGHPQPWLDTIPQVVIEIGNELVNFGGYGGPDYWRDLFEAGKRSPYYTKEKFTFVAGVLGGLGNPNAEETSDGIAVGGYICKGFNVIHEKYLNTDEKLFNWAKANSWQEVFSNKFVLRQAYESMKAAGRCVVSYEGNYHTNQGDAGPEYRNRLVPSVGAAVNYMNKMMLQMRYLQMKKMLFFDLKQSNFSGTSSGAFGNPKAGTVKIWGCVLSMKPGNERYRPHALGIEMLNKCIFGDMIDTVHSGANPTFSSTGVFVHGGRTEAFAKAPIETFQDMPELHSYAFASGKQRSLVLFNLDVHAAHPVKVSMPWPVTGKKAMCYLLTSDKITDNNEWENGSPKVRIVESELLDWQSGKTLTLPPFSLTGITFEVE